MFKFLAYVTPRAPMGSINKFQPIQSSRVVSYSLHKSKRFSVKLISFMVNYLVFCKTD